MHRPLITESEDLWALLTSKDGLAMSEEEAVRYARALQQLSGVLSMIFQEMMIEFHQIRRESYLDTGQKPD